ncbi:Serine/threonine-protein phosphatase 7 long form-like protein [Hordeum vulgare]|nr:Serine/threonine-protein phosphatase 7 long form-like protein [Hordeum vulgare]
MNMKREKRPPVSDNVGIRYSMLDHVFDTGHRARFIENGLLYNATQRMEKTSRMCGFVWALSIWMWERLPVGHSEKMSREPWTDYGKDGDSSRYPTVVYSWDVVDVYSSTSKALHKIFTNELDTLTISRLSDGRIMTKSGDSS